jgi:acyl-CoA oxidase
MDDVRAQRRAGILAQHFLPKQAAESRGLASTPCLSYQSPESNEGAPAFDVAAMRQIIDGHDLDVRDLMYSIFANDKPFRTKNSPVGVPVYTAMDYNTTKEEQREVTFERILHLKNMGLFKNWLTSDDPEEAYKKAAMHESISIYDHSMAIKLGVHVHLWGGAVKYLGTKRHHDKYLAGTEDYYYAGCFALTELGHGSNVRGIETLATYDAKAQEFVINTPCESAQKYWIGGAAQHANHTAAFAQLIVNGENKGVHAFVVPIRDRQGRLLRGVRILDCGHKMGLNGVDNGRIWFDNVRIPRENLLNAVADVTAEGKYVSPISDPDQRFAAFMAPLTGGRVTLAISSVNQSKVGLATALRYALSRRCFSPADGQPELRILDYPSHQRRLLPLLAKTYTMQFAVNELKTQYIHRKPSDAKFIHVVSSGYKALMSWHMSRTLQECREACGGQGFKSDNRIGQLKGEHDVTSTFEGDNHVLLQQVSKALLGDLFAAKKSGKPLRGMGLCHINGPRSQLPHNLTGEIVRDADFQLALFRLRERDLLERFGAQMGALLNKGVPMFDAFNQTYQLATELGKAHAERAILESGMKNGQKLATGSLRPVVDLLRSLTALAIVDEDPVFLRYGYLSPEQSQVVHKEVAALCSDVRPHTLGLVQSFGIPQHLLGPIAFDWIQYNAYQAPGKEAAIQQAQAVFEVVQ